VEKPKLDMIEMSDADIGNDEMKAKEDKEQPNKKGTSSKRPSRQKILPRNKH
jgi:hypothetical protein